jgi:hypothetical protein
MGTEQLVYPPLPRCPDRASKAVFWALSRSLGPVPGTYRCAPQEKPWGRVDEVLGMDRFLLRLVWAVVRALLAKRAELVSNTGLAD